MKEEKIVVLVKRVGMKPYRLKVFNQLHPLQAIVDGLIETIRVKPGLIVCVDEEAIMSWKPFNARLGDCQLFGDMFFCGVDGEEFVSITPEQEDYLKAEFPKLWEVR